LRRAIEVSIPTQSFAVRSQKQPLAFVRRMTDIRAANQHRQAVHFCRVKDLWRPSAGFAPRTRTCVRLDIAWIDSVAAFRACQDRPKVVPATQVSVEKRRPLLPREVLIAPMHQPNQDRVKV
jgi:hypothetical protein